MACVQPCNDNKPPMEPHQVAGSGSDRKRGRYSFDFDLIIPRFFWGAVMYDDKAEWQLAIFFSLYFPPVCSLSDCNVMSYFFFCICTMTAACRQSGLYFDLTSI